MVRASNPHVSAAALRSRVGFSIAAVWSCVRVPALEFVLRRYHPNLSDVAPQARLLQFCKAILATCVRNEMLDCFFPACDCFTFTHWL